MGGDGVTGKDLAEELLQTKRELQELQALQERNSGYWAMWRLLWGAQDAATAFVGATAVFSLMLERENVPASPDTLKKLRNELSELRAIASTVQRVAFDLLECLPNDEEDDEDEVSNRLPLGSALRFSRQGDGHTPRIAGRGGAKVHASAPLQRGPDARASPRFSARGGAFRALNPVGCCKGFDGPERKTEGKGAFFSRNGRFRERIFGVRFVAFAPKKRGAKRTECAEMRRPRLHKPAQWLLADVLRMSGGCPADAARGIAGSIQAALQAAYRRHTGGIRGVYGAYTGRITKPCNAYANCLQWAENTDSDGFFTRCYCEKRITLLRWIRQKKNPRERW